MRVRTLTHPFKIGDRVCLKSSKGWVGTVSATTSHNIGVEWDNTKRGMTYYYGVSGSGFQDIGIIPPKEQAFDNIYKRLKEWKKNIE